MAKTVDINGMQLEIVQAIADYTADVTAAIEREMDRTAKAVLDDTKANSPVRTGEYKKGWSRRKRTEWGAIRHVIYNRTKPSLTHLLEYGFTHTSGKRVEGRPHLRPAYDKHVPEMERNIKEIIKRGG